jgi:O-antigen ligase
MLVALAVAPNLATSLVALAVLALAIATRPDVGLMLAVFLVPLAPLLKSFGPARFSYLETVTLLALASQLGRDALSVAGWMRERQQGRVGPGSRPWPWLRQARALDLGLALLVAVSIASLLASENLRVSLRELRVVVLQAAFLYWLVVRCRLGRDGLLHLADVLVLSATVVSLQGLFQYLLTEQVIVAEGVRRVRGIYGSPNNLALVLGRAFPLMLATVLSVLRGPRRWLYGVAAALAALCLFLTFSRGAWFFGAPASLVALAFLAGRRWRIVIAGLAALALVGAVPLLGTARFASLFALEGTSLLRLKLWEAAWEMGWDHPWFGVGLDNFLYQYPRYIRPEAASEPHLSHPHNIALDFWLRLGLPGLLAFGWLQWRFFKEALALWRRPLDPALRALNVGLLAGMASMMAHGLVDASFFVVELAAIYALMVAFVRQMGGLEAI